MKTVVEWRGVWFKIWRSSCSVYPKEHQVLTLQKTCYLPSFPCSRSSLFSSFIAFFNQDYLTAEYRFQILILSQRKRQYLQKIYSQACRWRNLRELRREHFSTAIFKLVKISHSCKATVRYFHIINLCSVCFLKINILTRTIHLPM